MPRFLLRHCLQNICSSYQKIPASGLQINPCSFEISLLLANPLHTVAKMASPLSYIPPVIPPPAMPSHDKDDEGLAPPHLLACIRFAISLLLCPSPACSACAVPSEI